MLVVMMFVQACEKKTEEEEENNSNWSNVVEFCMKMKYKEQRGEEKKNPYKCDCI